ncbi:hypothetical protein OC842_001249 [Tilletia horrida]|uniref:Uncharacterized protein n=1 Tax=Tilletia horrida TaxID=155126 RepID=A0AAN6GFG4_9BASI|nr:hypothetical protein OC842_001249 [Tilletia horrida]
MASPQETVVLDDNQEDFKDAMASPDLAGVGNGAHDDQDDAASSTSSEWPGQECQEGIFAALADEEAAMDEHPGAKPWASNPLKMPLPRRYANPATFPDRLVQLIQLYDDVAALTPRASEAVLDLLLTIKNMLQRHAAKRQIVPLLEAICTRILILLKAIAKREAATGERDEVGTEKSVILLIVRRQLGKLGQKLTGYEFVSLGNRTRTHSYLKSATLDTLRRVTDLAREANIRLGLGTRQHRLATTRPLPPILSSRALRLAFTEQMGSWDKTIRTETYGSTPDVTFLLQLRPFLSRILHSTPPLDISMRPGKRSRSNTTNSDNSGAMGPATSSDEHEHSDDEHSISTLSEETDGGDGDSDGSHSDVASLSDSSVSDSDSDNDDDDSDDSDDSDSDSEHDDSDDSDSDESDSDDSDSDDSDTDDSDTDDSDTDDSDSDSEDGASSVDAWPGFFAGVTTSSFNIAPNVNAANQACKKILRRGSDKRLGFKKMSSAKRWMQAAMTEYFSLSIPLLRAKFFDRTDVTKYLHGLLVSLCHVGLYDGAAFVAEVLAMVLHESLAGDPTSVPLKQSLCYTLATLSLLYDRVNPSAVHIRAAEQAHSIFKAIHFQAGSGSSRRILAEAQFELLRAHALQRRSDPKGNPEGYEDVSRIVTLFAQALAFDPVNIEAKYGLARALELAPASLPLAGAESPPAAILAIYSELSVAKPLLFQFEVAAMLCRHASIHDDTEAGERALAAYQALVNDWPDPCYSDMAALHQLLAGLYKQQGALHQALRCVEAGVALYSHHSVWLSQKYSLMELRAVGSSVLMRLERYAEAYEHANAGRRQGPHLVSHFDRQRALCKLMVGDATQALQLMELAMRDIESECQYGIDDNPRHDRRYIVCLGELAAIQCAMGNLSTALENGAEALRRRQKYKRLHADDDNAWQRDMGRLLVFYTATLLKAGRHDESLVEVDDALELLVGGDGLGPVEKTALLLKAQALRRLSREDEAAALALQASMMPFRGFYDRLGCAS